VSPSNAIADQIVCTTQYCASAEPAVTGPAASCSPPNRTRRLRTNNTRAHIDMPMFGCTLLLDNELVIDKGRIIDPKMQV
jgi:hypothetical protein